MLSDMNFTEQEKEIIQHIRSLKPYERVEIQADKNGKANTFLLHKSLKVTLD